jgi:two-component system phosphate regulon sensor histidine kinase PhoR
MVSHRLIAALTPALAALLAGSLALAASAGPPAMLAAAALGAAVAALVLGSTRAEAPGTPSVDTHTQARNREDPAETHRLLDALPIGLVIVAADGTIRFANRHAAELFGLPSTAGQPGDQTGGLAVATIRVRRLLDLIEAALGEGTAGSVEFQLPRSGDVHLRAHVRPVVGGAGEVVVAIEDQTEARRAGELHRDFVANASHELKTPLAAVSGIIETLLGHARDDPAATTRFLGMLATQADRMTRLVEDLLSLNRIELNARVAPREPQDLSDVLAEAVETLRPNAEQAGVRLEYLPPDGRPQVRGDRNELSQLFGNLIENAIKYGGSGAEVRVAAVPRSADAPAHLGIAVSDTGPGIARHHIPRLTERFYRVSVRRSREKGGTGLGLAIVKHILNRHRGRLEIESRLGEGSRFTVWLPLAEAAPTRETRVPARYRVGTGASPR